MSNLKELSINNQSYYFYNDIINLKDFHSNLLKIDKKRYRKIDIYYIDYITIKKIDGCENINSVNPLYLMIHSARGQFKECDDKKYLVLDSTQKYEIFFQELKKKLKRLMVEKSYFMKKNYDKIDVNADDVPLYKPLKFPTLLIVIRCVL